MPRQNDSDQNANANSISNNKPKKERGILKRKADLLLKLLGAAAFITGVIGSTLISTHIINWGIVLIFSATITTTLDVHIYFRYLHRKHRIIWWPPFIAAIAAHFVIFAAPFLVSPAGSTFELIGGVPAFSPKLTPNAVGAFVATSLDKKRLFLIDVLLFVEIKNKLDTSRQMRGYTVEIRKEKTDWEPSCHVDLRDKLL